MLITCLLPYHAEADNAHGARCNHFSCDSLVERTLQIIPQEFKSVMSFPQLSTRAKWRSASFFIHEAKTRYLILTPVVSLLRVATTSIVPGERPTLHFAIPLKITNCP